MSEDQLVADGAWGGEERPPDEVERAGWERDGVWEREAEWQRWLADARLDELCDLDPDLSSADLSCDDPIPDDLPASPITHG